MVVVVIVMVVVAVVTVAGTHLLTVDVEMASLGGEADFAAAVVDKHQLLDASDGLLSAAPRGPLAKVDGVLGLLLPDTHVSAVVKDELVGGAGVAVAGIEKRWPELDVLGISLELGVLLVGAPDADKRLVELGVPAAVGDSTEVGHLLVVALAINAGAEADGDIGTGALCGHTADLVINVDAGEGCRTLFGVDARGAQGGECVRAGLYTPFVISGTIDLEDVLATEVIGAVGGDASGGGGFGETDGVGHASLF